ncbi:ATP-binding protein [Kineococcus terrestris]|uniref:ATP-binding protein n=1 Tax=Kineococcus terrestris TaxID=2044856 RepID=UPI0034DB5CFA
MPTVALRFSPLAEHVRTARLVAVSVARRAGFGEGQLDEIRIAIGEACARAVGRSPADGLVDMRLCDDDRRLEVTVLERRHDGAPLPPETEPEDPLALALLEGMADLVAVPGTTDDPREAGGEGGVLLSWQLPPEEPADVPGAPLARASRYAR